MGHFEVQIVEPATTVEEQGNCAHVAGSSHLAGHLDCIVDLDDSLGTVIAGTVEIVHSLVQDSLGKLVGHTRMAAEVATKLAVGTAPEAVLVLCNLEVAGSR